MNVHKQPLVCLCLSKGGSYKCHRSLQCMGGGSLASSRPIEDTFFSAELTASGLLVQPTPTDYEPQHSKSRIIQLGWKACIKGEKCPPNTRENVTDGGKQWLRNTMSRNESRRGNSLQFVRTWIHTVLRTTGRGAQAPSWVPLPELWPFLGCYMRQLSVTSAPLFGEHTRILQNWEQPVG